MSITVSDVTSYQPSGIHKSENGLICDIDDEGVGHNNVESSQSDSTFTLPLAQIMLRNVKEKLSTILCTVLLKIVWKFSSKFIIKHYELLTTNDLNFIIAKSNKRKKLNKLLQNFEVYFILSGACIYGIQ